MTRDDGNGGRPAVDGKFLRLGSSLFLVKGVSYGTFAPDALGGQLPPPERAAADFRLMQSYGINTVRTYTPPGLDLLDEAARCGLRVMVGLPWTQHVAFLDDRRLTQEIRTSLCETVRRLAQHPGSLLFALGNEIPAPIVRWHGPRRIERFLWELHEAVKSVAPEALLTYVNYPPTDFLDLSFLDVCAFNVFLHREKDMRAYLNRLHTIAGHKPLLLAEVGADSIRQGLDGQAEIVEMQVRSAWARGACGAVVFSWTDEWWRGGSPVEDWAFGLVDAQRRPVKPALGAAARAFADAPFSESDRAGWPRVTVAVCAYNAAATMDECLHSLTALTYPNTEILVVNDGSQDATGDIARRHPGVRVIDVANRGLSASRNIALRFATGEIIAYTDADVRVDPDWLTYLVQPFVTSNAGAAGGPNVVPTDDPWMAQCIARAPGGPTHVLLNEHIAEHVPGCNMAFRRQVLLDIGGFNPMFVRAGDDVDICWRLQRKGYRIAFAPSALVWHHHRRSVRAYWRQQIGYGEGEGWLMDHHPEKFAGDRPLWRGRIYSPLPFVRSLWPVHVNTGRWGTALFPSVYRKDVNAFAYMPHRFRWQVLSLALLGSGGLGVAMGSVLTGLLLLLAGAAGFTTTAARCLSFASRSDLDRLPRIGGCPPRLNRLLYTVTIGCLHYVQPFARAVGRIRAARAPGGPPLQILSRRSWAHKVSFLDFLTSVRLIFGSTEERCFWSESWLGADVLLSRITDGVRAEQAFRTVEVDEGWHVGRDIRVGVPGAGALDLRAVVEEHAGGRCLVRVATRVRVAVSVGVVPLGAAVLAGFATDVAIGIPVGTAAVVAPVAVAPVMVGIIGWQVARAVAVVRRVVQEVAESLCLSPMGEGQPIVNVRVQEGQQAAPSLEDVQTSAPQVRPAGVPFASHDQRHET